MNALNDIREKKGSDHVDVSFNYNARLKKHCRGHHDKVRTVQ